MKYYLYFNDDCFEKILDIEEVRQMNEKLYKKIMRETFGENSLWSDLSLSYEFEYKELFEIESSLDKKQLEEVLVHDFYVDVLEIAKHLGKVTRII